MKLPNNQIDSDIKSFLDEKVNEYNTTSFIEPDPISVPHRYTLKEDIEISGFLAATIAWGNRQQIVKTAHRLMDLMGESPYDFVMEHKNRHLDKLDGFVYRTFNETDAKYFIKAFKHIYKQHGGIEAVFLRYATSVSLQPAIHYFRKHFFEINHPQRTEKHVSDPFKGSAAKKINLFLRWMIRKDQRGVDFGLWQSLHPSQLSCPLDVHSGNIARKLGLLSRLQNDAKAVEELDIKLRLMDAEDPVKYDFALFGLGVYNDF